MINFWEKFSTNKKDELTIKIEIEMYILGNSEKNEELKNEYDKRLEANFYSNKNLESFKMQGINLSNPYVNPSLSSSIFYGIFG